MKRCKLCGRGGARMLYVGQDHSRAEMFACHDRQACGKRAATIGQWTGVRVLRRRDLDGTQWTIRRQTAGVSGGPLYMLACEYRQHRATTAHFTVEAAKAHREYAGGGQ